MAKIIQEQDVRTVKATRSTNGNGTRVVFSNYLNKRTRPVKTFSKEEVFPELKRIREDIEEHFGSGYCDRSTYDTHSLERNRKESVSPVMVEFRRVQKSLNDLANVKKMEPGQKRAKAIKIVNDFKAYLRRENVRYRQLWRSLEIPAY